MSQIRRNTGFLGLFLANFVLIFLDFLSIICFLFPCSDWQRIRRYYRQPASWPEPHRVRPAAAGRRREPAMDGAKRQQRRGQRYKRQQPITSWRHHPAAAMRQRRRRCGVTDPGKQRRQQRQPHAAATAAGKSAGVSVPAAAEFRPRGPANSAAR
jgi:hypothetical protein